MHVFSHSRLDAFETCPKKYEFSYIVKAPRGPGGIEAFMGNRVHEALEWLYSEVSFCRLPGVEDLVERYNDWWVQEWRDDVCVVRANRSVEDYRAQGEKALRDYHARYQPFDQSTTIGLEQRVDFPLDETGDIRVTGYIDRLAKVADGRWEIHDYKTSRRLPSQADADADRQLALYEIAVREQYSDVREVTLVWHYLLFDQEIRSTRTPEQLAQLRCDLLAGIRAAIAATEFPTRTSGLCDWCDYQEICPAFVHERVTAELSPDQFAAEPGVALVDRYMELTDVIDDLTAEREQVKAALVERADAQGLDRLVGTDYSVRVWRYEGAQLPKADDPRRTEIESVLKDAGLWEQYAQLSAYQLSKAIEGCRIPQETMEKLAPYVTMTKGVKLYPKKRT
jgi:putative RecB family exonuclease